MSGKELDYLRRMTLPDLESEVLKLSAAERAVLAEVLLKSLDDLTEDENERLWAEEAQRRYAASVDDPAQWHSAEGVLRAARGRLK